MAFKTSTKSARSTNIDVRRPITFELVTSLCPDPQIAQNIVHLGVDLAGLTTKATLAEAFSLALSRRSLKLVRQTGPEASRAAAF